MNTKIKPSELKVGDVLLYHGHSLIDKFIMDFDGSEYSHSSIFYDGSVLEAISNGVKKTPLNKSVADKTFVDVYRFISTDGKQKLGDKDFPAQPVLDRIHFYESEGDRYAYEQLILLALLTTTRRIRIPVVGWLLRHFLDQATSVLNKIIAAGKEPMICSELVYRCYSEAMPVPKYELSIRGVDIPLAGHALPLASMHSQDINISGSILGDNESAAIKKQMEDFLVTYAQSKRRTKKTMGNMALHSTASLMAVPDFVTPRDLKQTPNLFAVGTLQV